MGRSRQASCATRRSRRQVAPSCCWNSVTHPSERQPGSGRPREYNVPGVECTSRGRRQIWLHPWLSLHQNRNRKRTATWDGQQDGDWHWGGARLLRRKNARSSGVAGRLHGRPCLSNSTPKSLPGSSSLIHTDCEDHSGWKGAVP